MKQDEERYRQYDIEPVQFDMESFQSSICGHLVSLGYNAECERLIAEGSQRLFAKTKLNFRQTERVNKAVGMNAARHAEGFQHKVQQTTIRENFDAMVNLRELSSGKQFGWTFTDTRYHEACGEWAGKERLFWVRQPIALQLADLAERLYKIDLRMHFEDGFRPLGVQEGLFKRRIEMARALNADWSDAELVLEAKSKTAYTPRLAAHKAGAAVDVRLVNVKTDSFLDIGHDYPDGGEIVRLNTEFVSQEQWQNRKILEALARTVGLSMYPYEDWHLSSRDATAAVVDGNSPYVAEYGPIKQFNAATGEVTEVYSQEELDTVFSLG